MHRNNFDALRLIAAMAVLVSHQFMLTVREQPMPYAGIPLGTYAVYAFFAISGYLVTQSWLHDPSWWRFSARRFLRIAPGYAVVIAVVPLALWAIDRTDFTGNPHGIVNGSLWTIPLEVQCYVLLLILCAASSLGPVAFAALSLLIGHDTPLAEFSGFFAVGTLLAAYPRLMRWRLAVVLAGMALLAAGQTHYGTVLVLTPLVLWIGTASWPVLRDAGRYGDVSYGTYLYAFPVQQFVILWLGRDAPFASLLSLSIAVTLVVAWLSWRLVERPALRLKPSGVGERRGGRSEGTVEPGDALGNSEIVDVADQRSAA